MKSVREARATVYVRTTTACHANWHAWENDNPFAQRVLLSDEDNKQLRYFHSWDDAINWLYLNGHKDAARAINKQVKEAR